jgi:hypothetical protein
MHKPMGVGAAVVHADRLALGFNVCGSHNNIYILVYVNAVNLQCKVGVGDSFSTFISEIDIKFWSPCCCVYNIYAMTKILTLSNS